MKKPRQFKAIYYLAAQTPLSLHHRVNNLQILSRHQVPQSQIATINPPRSFYWDAPFY